MLAFIDPDKCLRCLTCRAAMACPIKAIFRIDECEPNLVDPKYCRGCGECMPSCHANAILLRDS